MDVRELKEDMDGQFGHVRSQFEHVRSQFEHVRSQFERVQRQFEQVDRRFTELKAELKEDIAAEGEKTRRHFDIVAEQMKAEQILLIDRAMGTHQQLLGLTASNAADHVGFVYRLDDHEQRLKRIEKK